MTLLKSKSIYIFGGLALIIIETAIILIFWFIFTPINNSFVYNAKLILKTEKLDKNIRQIKTLSDNIIYYRTVKPLNYKQHLKKTLIKLKILIYKTDEQYHKFNTFIARTSVYTEYNPEFTKYFKKNYFQWVNINKPILKKIIKYYKYISPKISFRFFLKYSLSLSTLPTMKITKEAVMNNKNKIPDVIYTFYIGAIFILIYGVLLIYFIDKFFNMLRQSEQKFKSMFDNQPVVCLVLDVESGRIIDANISAVKFYGYSIDELTNMTIDQINVDTPTGEQRKYRQTATADKSGYAIFKHRLKNMDVKIIESNISVVILGNKTYLLAIINDITEMINAKNELEKEREFFKILIENVPAAISLNKEKIIYVNSEMERLTGYSKEELYNINIWDIFDLDEKRIEEMKANIKRRLNGDKFFSQYTFKLKNIYGNILWVKAFVTTIFYNGEWVALGILSDITDKILEEQNILKEKTNYKELSELDGLTGIYNRRAFDNKLSELLNIAIRYKRPLSLIMFDIDGFKEINDTWGHGTGDFVLKELAKITTENLRTTDFFTRYGGEEFMIITPETAINTAKELAERLRLKIENHNFNIETKILCSFGVASINDGDTKRSIVYRVDLALYKAKQNGKNRVEAL